MANLRALRDLMQLLNENEGLEEQGDQGSYAPPTQEDKTLGAKISPRNSHCLSHLHVSELF